MSEKHLGIIFYFTTCYLIWKGFEFFANRHWQRSPLPPQHKYAYIDGLNEIKQVVCLCFGLGGVMLILGLEFIESFIVTIVLVFLGCFGVLKGRSTK